MSSVYVAWVAVGMMIVDVIGTTAACRKFAFWEPLEKTLVYNSAILAAILLMME